MWVWKLIGLSCTPINDMHSNYGFCSNLVTWVVHESSVCNAVCVNLLPMRETCYLWDSASEISCLHRVRLWRSSLGFGTEVVCLCCLSKWLDWLARHILPPVPLKYWLLFVGMHAHVWLSNYIRPHKHTVNALAGRIPSGQGHMDVWAEVQWL